MNSGLPVFGFSQRSDGPRVLKVLVDFDRPVKINSWSQDMELASVPAERGLAIMGRSKRWDECHTTANVRVLADEDRLALNTEEEMDIPENFPVTFHQ